MDKDELLKQIDRSNISEEDKQIWREAMEFLSADVLETLGNELENNQANLLELTAEIKKQKEAILNHV